MPKRAKSAIYFGKLKFPHNKDIDTQNEIFKITWKMQGDNQDIAGEKMYFEQCG